MKLKHQLPALALGCLLAACQGTTTHSTFTPGEIWADNNGTHINAHGGGILLHKGVYYWFGEHKTEGEEGNLTNVGVHCYSSTDLEHWTDEGIALSVEPEGSGSPIETGCILERPKVIYNAKTKQFVMWFHLEQKGDGYGSACSGVAVSDKATSPFRFLRAGRINPGHWPANMSEEERALPVRCEGAWFDGGHLPAHPDSLNILGRDLEAGQMARDMNLFVDDDGKAYHIYSSEENSTLQIALLDDTYTQHTGEYTRHFVGRFMEAPALFKRNGKYYLMMSGCTGWRPNEARSAVADHIMGPWTELGNPCIDDTTHTTFASQSTYILPVGNDQFIYMGDRWTPANAIDGRYIWLPITFEGDRFFVSWHDQWSIDF